MPLFEFELVKLDEIILWGTRPEHYLSWFSLTDSIYHIDVRGRQLFRYSEVASFHERLMESMQARIEELARYNPIPHVIIDMKALMAEQSDRRTWLAKALNRAPQEMNENRVLKAIADITQPNVDHSC